MHPDLEKVIELQQVDLKIGELSAQIDALPAQVQALESQLHEFLHALEDRKHRLAENQKERRELESETQAVQSRISKHKDQLYEVKTNEQYKAMLKEIEGEEANIRKIEDQILEKMMEADELRKNIQEAEARLESEKARVRAETERLDSLRQVDVAERDKLSGRRRELSDALSETTREIYERMRSVRNGVAIAEVREGFCTACNVCLRPQLYNEVRTNDALHVCESCSRILYYVERAAGEETLNGAQRPGDQAAAPH